jgi:hypothetical protein
VSRPDKLSGAEMASIVQAAGMYAVRVRNTYLGQSLCGFSQRYRKGIHCQCEEAGHGLGVLSLIYDLLARDFSYSLLPRLYKVLEIRPQVDKTSIEQ